MAFEIQEIGIRMRVEDPDAKPERALAAEAKAPSQDDDCGCGETDREGIVEDCVRRVLWTLDALGQR